MHQVPWDTRLMLGLTVCYSKLITVLITQLYIRGHLQPASSTFHMTSLWNLQINRGDIVTTKMVSDNDLRHWRNQLSHSTCDFFHPSWQLGLWWIFAGEFFCPAGPLLCPDRPQIWCHSRMCFALCQESLLQAQLFCQERLYLALPLDCISLCQLFLWKEPFKVCSFFGFQTMV